MAAKIRLKRVGRRGQPSYRVVVLDGQKPRDAKVVADLGHYDPKTNPPIFEVDGDEALKWLLDGAKPTRAARGVLSKAGVMAAWDAAKRGETVAIEAKELKPTVKPKKPEAEAAPAEAEGSSDEGELEESAETGPETVESVEPEDAEKIETGEEAEEPDEAPETEAVSSEERETADDEAEEEEEEEEKA
mgnify:CR=1 FL=1